MTVAPTVDRVEIRVRYAETDQMGIAHHSNYLRWFEVGRIRLLDLLGFSYRSMEERGEFLPVLEMGIKYLRAAHFDEQLILETRLLDVSPSRMQFGALLHDPRSDFVLAKAYSSHGMTDASGAARALPEDLVKILSTAIHPDPLFGRKRRAFRY